MAPQSMNAVFYATSYHPIQAGSIDGTDTVSHDNGVYRALVASSTGLYDPTADSKATGDPYNTLFIGRLASHTTEKTLHEAMSRYGTVKQLRLVRDIVTGASRRYAFVEFESEDEMQNAYEVAQHHIIDGSPIIVDYNRQQLMTGWIPRRLGGGLGGRKESGQLRFGGRDRPFRAPLRPIPEEHLIKLGIPLPPVGQYMSRFQLPPIPQRQGHLQSSQRNQRRHKRSPSNEALRFERQGGNNDRVVGLDRQPSDSHSVGRRHAESSKRFPEKDSKVKHQQSVSNVQSEEFWENEPRKHHKKRSYSERARDDPSDHSKSEYQKQPYKKRSQSEIIDEERYQYPMSPSSSQVQAGNASHDDRSYRDYSGQRSKDGILEYAKSSRRSHERRAHSKSRVDRSI